MARYHNDNAEPRVPEPWTRYDLRQGLLDFGRTLSATTAMEPLLDSLTERLVQVLDVEKVAIFIEDERAPAHFRIAKSAGLSESSA